MILKELFKSVAPIVVACGYASYEAVVEGRGWRAVIGAFIGCAIARQMQPLARAVRK